jgi:hypothetical protein
VDFESTAEAFMVLDDLRFTGAPGATSAPVSLNLAIDAALHVNAVNAVAEGENELTAACALGEQPASELLFVSDFAAPRETDMIETAPDGRFHTTESGPDSLAGPKARDDREGRLSGAPSRA